MTNIECVYVDYMTVYLVVYSRSGSQNARVSGFPLVMGNAIVVEWGWSSSETNLMAN